jgi:branched-chain amino acid transport system substrate-binding protein
MSNDRTSLDRRTLLKAGMAGTGLLAMPHIAGAQANATFKVGATVPLTGSQAIEGKSHLDGFRLYMDQINWTAGGRKIELIAADDEMKPPVGLQKTRRLIENDNVDLLIGPVSSGNAIAMLDYVKQANKVWICSGAGLAALTREKRIPLLFRTSCSSWQTNSPIGAWAPEHLGHEAVLIAPDFAGGHDTMAEFRQAFTAKGGKVLNEIYPPLGNKDFLPYLADVKSAKPAFVYAFFSGADTVAFLQQYGQSGLKETIPLATSGFTTHEQALDAVGPAAIGTTSCLHYTAAYDSPVNKAFVKAFEAATKVRANYGGEYGYVAAQVIATALNKTGGKSDKPEEFAEAVKAVQFEAPRGPFRFDPTTHNVINRAYLTRVGEQDGRLSNVIVQIIENVVDPGVSA